MELHSKGDLKPDDFEIIDVRHEPKAVFNWLSSPQLHRDLASEKTDEVVQESIRRFAKITNSTQDFRELSTLITKQRTELAGLNIVEEGWNKISSLWKPQTMPAYDSLIKLTQLLSESKSPEAQHYHAILKQLVDPTLMDLTQYPKEPFPFDELTSDEKKEIMSHMNMGQLESLAPTSSETNALVFEMKVEKLSQLSQTELLRLSITSPGLNTFITKIFEERYGGYPRITYDQALEAFQGIPGNKITTLKLCSLTIKEINSLSSPDNFYWLKHLDVSGLKENEIYEFKRFSGLQSLIVDCNSVTIDFLSFRELNRLEKLSIDFANHITRPWSLIDTLIDLPRLKNLTLLKYRFPDEYIFKSFCEKFRNLNSLSLNIAGFDSMSDATIANCGKLTNLEHLTIEDREWATDSNINFLSELKKLKSLCLYTGNMGQFGLEVIGKINTLENLVLKGCHLIKDTDFEGLAGLDNLKSLSIFKSEIGQLDLKCLGKVKNLQVLKLTGKIIGEESLINHRISQLKERGIKVEIFPEPESDDNTPAF
jgi:Leucine-rich repeat (LRR) protein